MKSEIFIPSKIKVGFQKRDDTYSKRLAYVICYGTDGKLRKEKSWEQWRSKDIDPVELNNEPFEGFILNKDVQRYNWGHFGSNRSYIRVFDPRGGGIEFEIKPENLTAILTCSDCVKRSLVGQFIYSWSGKDLVLLPCISEEYQKAKEFTERQYKNIGVKDLKDGCSYKTKKGDDTIYVGRYMWYQAQLYGRKVNKSRIGKKYHIFTPDDGKTFETKNSLEFLALKNSDEIVINYLDILEKFQQNIHSSKIIDCRIVPCEFSEEIYNPYPQYYKDEYYFKLRKPNYFIIRNDSVVEYSVERRTNYNYDVSKRTLTGYEYNEKMIFNIKTQCLEETNRNVYDNKVFTKDQLDQLGWGDLEVTLDNGRKILVQGLYEVLC